MELYSVNSGVEPDDDDIEIAGWRSAARDRRDGPRVGDFIDLADGRTLRFSHVWDNGLQVSKGGSFYLSPEGLVSFSGGLEPPVLREDIIPVCEMRPGHFWFFHHDHHRAYNAVGVRLACRVYRQRPTEDQL